MDRSIHFISGLPRSGSTLLSAILKQNPICHAAIQSPLADIVRQTIQAMSAAESAVFMDDNQRKRIVTALFREYYAHFSAERVAFDSNRSWSAMVPLIAEVVPRARVVCCVRNQAWVMDSIERLVQANSVRSPKIFAGEPLSVYSRLEQLATKHLVGPCLSSLRQAWFGEFADRLVLLRYQSLVERPRECLDALYDALGLEPFDHDFENVEHDEPEFDDRLGLPGMHRVHGPVAPRPRQSILPSDLFAKYDDEFWEDGENPKSVCVI